MNEKYEVEKGLPVKREYHTLPPLKELDIEESMIFPYKKRSSVQSVASRIKKANGMEFTIKRISETECRVWRVK